MTQASPMPLTLRTVSLSKPYMAVKVAASLAVTVASGAPAWVSAVTAACAALITFSLAFVAIGASAALNPLKADP